MTTENNFMAELGGGRPLAEVLRRPIIENPRGPEKGEDASSLVANIVKIDLMPAERRATLAEINDRYCKKLNDLAMSDKAIAEDNKIFYQRQELIDGDDDTYTGDHKYEGDKAYINGDPTRTEKEKVALQELLNDLDEAELRRDEYERTVKEKSNKSDWFSAQGWEDQEKKLKQFEDRVAALQGEIADPDFLGRRNSKKERIEEEIRKIKQKSENDDEEEKRKMIAEADEWEKGLEEKDREIKREELPADIPIFSEALQRLKDQEVLKNEPSFNEAEYKQAKEIVGWYFQEAGRLGILFDLDQQLDSDFEEYMIHLRFEPVDERRFPPPKMTISALRDSIKEKLEGRRIESQGLIIPGAPENAEKNWPPRETIRFSSTLLTPGHFDGIRAEYLTRGYEHMRASFTNLIHLQERLRAQTDLLREDITSTEYENKIARIPKDTQQNLRVYGEWNFGFETKVRSQLERQALAEQAKPLFHETELGFIVLEGKNSRQIELAAEQAAEFITSSVGTYSLESVQQRREYLLRAIENKRSILLGETGGIKSKTDDLVDRIKQVALNKLDFFILHWLAQNLRMPEYSSYFEQMVMQNGTDRLKKIPTMSDGLVGLAIRYFLMPEYRLFFKSGGFRNQLNTSAGQSYQRDKLEEEMVERLIAFELDDQGKGWQGKAKMLQDLMKVQSTEEFLQKFIQKGALPPGKFITNEETNKETNLTLAEYRQLENQLTPKQRLDFREVQYKNARERAERAKANPNDDLQQALIELREAREIRAFEKNRYETAKNRVKNAVEEAVKVMDITGESAKIGAPTVIMNNGDHISIDDAKLFYKFAILQAAKDYSQTGGMEDNLALIRWRARTWIDRWKKQGLDRTKTSRDFQTGTNGNKLGVRLKEGWEETGLTEREWTKLEEAVTALRTNGHGAVLEINRRDDKGRLVRDASGNILKDKVRFEDVIKDPKLQPVLNNFMADYKSSKDQLQDDYLRTQAFKGRLGTLKNILVRLGLKKPVGTHQQVMDEYTQRIEDSRALDAEVERLVYYEATHNTLTKVKAVGIGQRLIYTDPAFSADRIDYGVQGLPWGIKRAQRRKAFEYANLRRTAPRAVDLIHAIPTSLTSLSQESASEDLLNFFWDQNRLEKDDNWTLMTFAYRTKDAWYVGGRLEGDIVEAGGKLDKDWGFLEKPLVDSNGLLELFKPGDGKGAQYYLNDLNRLKTDFKEAIVGAMWGKPGAHLGRFAPIVIGAHKQLSEDRQALGSGAGFEESEKFALRFLEWLMSSKQASELHGAREEGGMKAFGEVVDVIRLITAPQSYNEDSSIWDEIWRKATPGHNPRIPKAAPEPTYALAA